MGGNPLALAFLALAGVLFGLTILFVVLQKKMFQKQAREIQELLREARNIAAAEGDREPDDD
jgi:rRNA maturation protein Rpf1